MTNSRPFAVARAGVRRDSPAPTGNGLAELLDDGVTPWHRAPVPLPRRLTLGLRTTLAVDVLTTGWMATTIWSGRFCRHGWCGLASFGHPAVLGGLAFGAVLLLLGLAVPTAGFTRADAPALALLAVATLAGWTATLGLVVLVLITLSVLALTITLLVSFTGGLDPS